MSVSFAGLKKGSSYSRKHLADLWGYEGYQALARGLVTPRGDNKLILFITEGDGQQQTIQRYTNQFDGRVLTIEGPEDHFAEDRLLNSSESSDEIHLFHRVRHRSDFKYYGMLMLVESELHQGRPSSFTFIVA